eukprot:13431945-Heterocapsa_arctica.AAC.1
MLLNIPRRPMLCLPVPYRTVLDRKATQNNTAPYTLLARLSSSTALALSPPSSEYIIFLIS